MSVQKLREYFISNWQSLAAYGGLFGILGLALTWQLNSLTPGYAQVEADTYNHSLSFQDILDNPLNAPFLLAVKLLLYIHPNSYLATRIVSAAAGAIVLVIFAALLRHWHSTRTAIFATLLFGLSAWFLHTARLGTPDVLLFGVFVLTASGFWLKQSNSSWALLACFVGAALLLYVPGMLWFILLGLIWQWRAVDQVFKKHLLAVTTGGLLLLGTLVPLGWGLYKHLDLIKPWLGLPQQWPTIWQMAKNLLGVPFHLLVRSAPDPVSWLGVAPVLDVFTLVMFLLGTYLYLRNLRLTRVPVFLFIFIVTIALMAIGNPSITYSVIMPFVYVIAAAGITYLLGDWLRVFPRNPIARAIGWSLMSLVIAASCLYHTTHYFIGWPQASATHHVYIYQKP